MPDGNGNAERAETLEERLDRRVDDETVVLKIPNHEVRKSLEEGYVSRLLGKDFELDAMIDTAKETAATLAAEGYTPAFKAMLQSAYSRLPHDWLDKDEKEIKRYFLAFMIFANADVSGEPQHATGRPDAVLLTEKGIYVFEFKFAQSAAAAIRQCRDRNYDAAFAGDERPVYYPLYTWSEQYFGDITGIEGLLGPKKTKK